MKSRGRRSSLSNPFQWDSSSAAQHKVKTFNFDLCLFRLYCNRALELCACRANVRKQLNTLTQRHSLSMTFSFASVHAIACVCVRFRDRRICHILIEFRITFILCWILSENVCVSSQRMLNVWTFCCIKNATLFTSAPIELKPNFQRHLDSYEYTARSAARLNYIE